MTRIVLLTDFGTADGYVAALKGVLASRAPHAGVEDAAHDIQPGDIAGAAWALRRYAHLYPPGTVHLVVVDPGVGSGRRGMAAAACGRLFVAPDNGVLALALEGCGERTLVELRSADHRRHPVAPTFHGRDLFAPAAAHLANGGSPTDLGPPLQDPVGLELPRPRWQGEVGLGEVVHVDRFGTLVTNIPGEWAATRAGLGLAVGEPPVSAPLRRTYADVGPGQLVALVGSDGLLEVAVRDGSAAALLGLGRGAPVRLAHLRKGGAESRAGA